MVGLSLFVDMVRKLNHEGKPSYLPFLFILNYLITCRGELSENSMANCQNITTLIIFQKSLYRFSYRVYNVITVKKGVEQMVFEVVGSVVLVMSPFIVAGLIMSFINWSRKYPIW